MPQNDNTTKESAEERKKRLERERAARERMRQKQDSMTNYMSEKQGAMGEVARIVKKRKKDLANVMAY